MRDQEGEIWGIILAAGDGQRLAAVTVDACGRVVPKQYCALAGTDTLLDQTVARLAAIVPRRRILCVVAEAHRRHWQGGVGGLPPENIVVQPENRGTAAGLLLPLLEIARRDPAARVIATPADHFVADERHLTRSLLEALTAIEGPADRLLLLGIAPDAPVGDYGWIVAQDGNEQRPAAVERFVEKPGEAEARRIASAGGVWNSFLMVGRLRRYLKLFERRRPELLRDLRRARFGGASALAKAYRGLAPSDFSRDLLQGSEAELGLIVVPACGWTDLGTPERLASLSVPSPGRAGVRAAQPRPGRRLRPASTAPVPATAGA